MRYACIQSEDNKEKRMKKSEESPHEFCDNIKNNNLHIFGVPEGEEWEKGAESLFRKIMITNSMLNANSTSINLGKKK